ncbi:hypothetical protein [Mesorhizobium sp.]|uniref:hypothetical protein n=1 Tax=Mesorhizobium sp. TaxID=1871066 RepID=UPI000FE8FAC9|nr:hypothetical protein [Mesorhizobium sp.]RWP30697.1 MAG: hypothetical protein EOR03_24255 [Mesorhizobium sp.]
MKNRAATIRDFRLIKADLAHRMAAEYRQAGWEPTKALETFKPRIKEGNADAITTDEGEAIAIIAFFVDDGAIHTSFAAREEFFGWQGFREVWRHIRTIQARLGNLPVRSNSYPQDPRTEDWFRKLGFRVVERAPNNIVFELDPR